jgi:hypothetical protein
MARAWARTFVEGGQPQVPDERWVAVIGTWSMSRGASTVSSPRSPPADPWLVPSALASVLGPLRLPLSRLGRLFGRPTGAAGARQLRNYAHVIETGPALAVAVLKGAGGVHIWQPATLTAAEARGFPAIQLFVERAGANLGALSRMRRSSVQGGRRGVSSRRTWPSSHAIGISRSQIVSSRHAISIADNFRSRTEASRFRSIPSSSEIVASREAIRASRCSSHPSRWATARKSFLVRTRAATSLLCVAAAQIPNCPAEAVWALTRAATAGSAISAMSPFAAR